MRRYISQALDVVEAIYRPVRSDRGWIDGILAAARPALDCGLGIVAYPFEVAGTEVRIPWARVVGTSRGVGPAFFRSLLATSQADAQVSRAYRATPTCATASELGLAMRPGFEMFRRKGVFDSSGLTGFDTAGHGVFLGGLLSRPTRLTAEFRACYSRVAAHLGVGLRYRRLAKAAGRPPEAVFSAGSELLHAEGEASTREAREALVRAVVALDRARGRQRRTAPDRALAAWKGLVEARWSLVEEFESDGKRFVVARENEPLAPEVVCLPKRERQIVGYLALGHSTKLIAYELGLAEATVRVLVHRSMRRLGVADREALVARFMIACRSPIEGGSDGA